MATIILNCLPIFFTGFSYLSAVFLLLFGFGSLFRLLGISSLYNKHWRS